VSAACPRHHGCGCRVRPRTSLTRGLAELAFDGNPITEQAGYRTHLIAHIKSLRHLDMKRITDEVRTLSVASDPCADARWWAGAAQRVGAAAGRGAEDRRPPALRARGRDAVRHCPCKRVAV
jgi:hypothetical protein